MIQSALWIAFGLLVFITRKQQGDKWSINMQTAIICATMWSVAVYIKGQIMNELTQEEVDSAFLKIKNAWDKVVEESGMTEAEFIDADTSGCVEYYLSRQKELREQVESVGLNAPDLTIHQLLVDTKNQESCNV